MDDGLLPPEAVAEVERIANALGKSVEEVGAEILKAADDSYPFFGKLAIYKSANKNALSGVKRRLYIIPLHIGDRRVAKRRDGTETDVLDVLGLMNPAGDENFQFSKLSLWGATNVLAADDLKIDTLFSFGASVNTQSNRVSFSDEAFKEEPQAIDVDEAVSQLPGLSVGELPNYLNDDVIVRGYVGRIISKESSSGLELSDPASNPQMCWLPQGTELPESEWLGREVLVIGYGKNNDKGELSFNGKRAFRV